MLSGAVHCIDADMEYAEWCSTLHRCWHGICWAHRSFDFVHIPVHLLPCTLQCWICWYTYLTNTNDNKSYFMCFFLFFFFTHVQADILCSPNVMNTISSVIVSSGHNQLIESFDVITNLWFQLFFYSKHIWQTQMIINLITALWDWIILTNLIPAVCNARLTQSEPWSYANTWGSHECQQAGVTRAV